MKPLTGVRGICRHEEALIRAIRRLRENGYQNFQTFAPVPSERLLKLLAQVPSPVHIYTFSGCLLGFLLGLCFPIWSSLQWKMISGGKPIVSIPPFLVIAFELTMLLGGVFTVAGLVIHAGILRPARIMDSKEIYDPRFSSDRFGIFVACAKAEVAEVQELIRAAGLEEVSHEGR